MANNVLTAQINITAPGVANTTKLVSKGLDGITISAIKTGSAVTNLQKQVAAFGGGAAKFTSQFTASFGRVPQAVNSAGAALSKLPNASNAATLSLINLGRVAQDAPFGFLGIANNLNPLLESFQRLKAQTGTTGGAFKALATSLTGAGGVGLALSVVSSLLIVFGDKLFGSKANTEASEAALRKYKQAVDDAAESVDDLTTNIAFLTQLGAINLKINAGGSSAKGDADLFSLRQQSILQRDLVFDLNTTRQKLLDNIDKANKDEELSNKDRITAVDDLQKKLNDIDKKINEESNKQRIIYRQIALQKVDDEVEAAKKLKDAQDKAKADYDKYVAETIAKGKELAEAFKKIGAVVPEFTIFDSLQDEFKKASQVVNEFNTATFKFKIIPELFLDEPALNSEVERTKEQIDAAFKGLFGDGVTITEPVDFTLINATLNEKTLESFRAQFAKFGQKLPDINLGLDQGDFTAQLQKSLDDVAAKFAVATTAAQAASNAFGSAFDALLKGDNAIQAIGNALKELVIQFIKATIQALILKAVTNLLLPGAGAVGGGAISGLLSNFGGFRAGGGGVNSGKSYIVGENGPEIFTPNTGGNIVPNNQLGGGVGYAANSGGGVITLRLAGYDLMAALALNQMKQGRLS